MVRATIILSYTTEYPGIGYLERPFLNLNHQTSSNCPIQPTPQWKLSPSMKKPIIPFTPTPSEHKNHRRLQSTYHPQRPLKVLEAVILSIHSQFHRPTTSPRSRCARSPTLRTHLTRPPITVPSLTIPEIRQMHKRPRPSATDRLRLPDMQPSTCIRRAGLHSSRSMLRLLHLLPRRTQPR